MKTQDELIEENKKLELKLTKLQGIIDYLETKRLTQASTIEGLTKRIVFSGHQSSMK